MGKNSYLVVKKASLQTHRREIMLWVMIILAGILSINLVSAVWDSSLNVGLTHYWDFNETSGTNFMDAGGRDKTTQLNITGVNTIANSSGKIGYAVSCNGATSHGDTLGNNANPSNSGSSSYSLSLWFWDDQDASWTAITSLDVEDEVFTAFPQTSGVFRWSSYSGHSIVTGTGNFSIKTWTHVVVTYDGVNGITYIDGEAKKTGSLNAMPNGGNFSICWTKFGGGSRYYMGKIDEVGIWNRTLTQTDVTKLYNSGNGITYIPPPPANGSVTLNSPSDGYSSLSAAVNFDCNVSSTDTITNISLYLNGVINYTEAGAGTTNLSLGRSLNLSKGNYNWTCAGKTAAVTYWASSNRTLTISSFIENSQTFNNQTTEGSSETFSINITYDSSAFSNILANLIYNKTSYTGTKTGSGDNAIFTRSITIPYITIETNISFYWEIGLINSTGTYLFNSTSHNQSVLNLGFLDDCSTYSVLVLNYTMKDERTQAVIVNATYNASIELDIQVYPTDSTTLLLNHSQIYYDNNAMVCLQSNLTNNSQYRLYAQARYKADEYVARYNYLQNFVLKNSTIPQNINLFDLKSTQATKFQITFKDSTFLAVADALINIKKKYISEGTFKTVEIEKTDNYGITTAYFDLTGVIYSITVTKEGELLATFDNLAIFCEDAVIGNCKLSLDAGASTISIIDFYTYSNLAFTESFNQTTRTYTLNFNVLDSSVADIGINLTKFDGYMNTTVCSNAVTTSSGTLTCAVPSTYGNITFTSEIYLNNQLISTSIWKIISTVEENVFAGNMVFFALGIVISFGVMLIPSAIGVIFGTLVGLGVAIVLVIRGSLILAGAFSFLIVAGIIIIWKIRTEGGD